MEYTDTGVTDDGWRRGQMVALARQLKLQARPERTCMHAKRHKVHTDIHAQLQQTTRIYCTRVTIVHIMSHEYSAKLHHFFFFARPDLVGILSNR